MRHVALLRGINLGARHRVPMADLRSLLAEAGYADVRTYVQSGNVVLGSGAKAAEVQAELARLIEARFGFAVPVIVRSRAQLARVVAKDPLGDIAENPKRYQVSFLDRKPSAETVAKLEGLVHEREGFVADGLELYAYHHEGVARSKLWNALAGKGLGVTATARNWTTVTALLEMASE